MLRTSIVVTLLVGLITLVTGQETQRDQRDDVPRNLGSDLPASSALQDQQTEIAPRERLKRNPNDADAIGALARSIWLQFTTDVEKPAELKPPQIAKASLTLDRFEEFLHRLPVQTPAAKAAVDRALRTSTTCRQILAVRTTSLAELERRLLKEPKDDVAIWSYRMKFNRQLGLLARDDPEAASQQLAAVKRVIEQIEDAFSRIAHEEAASSSAEVSEFVQAQRAMASLELDIERSLNNKAVLDSLIGTESVPLAPVDAWVNGKAWAEEDLLGKVVLLNFCWADWQDWPRGLQQRIAWDKAYRKQGLVVLNVTTYHNQRWNDETNRPIRVLRRDEIVPPTEQRKAVASFCRHHQMQFPIAMQTQADHFELCHTYGENPQMVLIDQDGKVRLAVNSGQTMLEQVNNALSELFPVDQSQ